MKAPRFFYRHAGFFRWVMSCFPPYWGTGISVSEVSPDFGRIVVVMKDKVWNRNALGTHFGGSLYAMCDPFYCLMLIARLGRGYVVWDQAASIEFIKPGQGRMKAEFVLTDAQIADIRAQAEGGKKVLPEFEVLITNEANDVVARVHKTLYVRERRKTTPPTPAAGSGAST